MDGVALTPATVWLSSEFDWNPTAWHLRVGDVVGRLAADRLRIVALIEMLFLDVNLHTEMMEVAPMLGESADDVPEYDELDLMGFLDHDIVRTAAFGVDLLRASGLTGEAEIVNGYLMDRYAQGKLA